MMGENVYQAGPRIVIQAVDERGNPLGRAIKINEDAVIAVGGRKREVMSRNGERFHVYDVKVRTSGKEDTVEGIYGIFEDDLEIKLRGDRAWIGYIGLPTLLHYLREKGPMRLGGVLLKGGEKVDIKVRQTYREVGREDETPVIDENVYLRIEMLPPQEHLKALTQGLYSK